MIKVAINTVSFRTPHLRRAVVHNDRVLNLEEYVLEPPI